MGNASKGVVVVQYCNRRLLPHMLDKLCSFSPLSHSAYLEKYLMLSFLVPHFMYVCSIRRAVLSNESLPNFVSFYATYIHFPCKHAALITATYYLSTTVYFVTIFAP